MRVWIDLSNSPHALLFAPLARTLAEQGDELLVTARRFAHTVELAATRFPDLQVVGSGPRESLAGKATSLAQRVAQLIPVARRFRPDVCVSHGSYAQVVAARLLRRPSLVSVDYEYQPANHLSFRLATRLLLPAAMREEDIAARGARPATTWRYEGLKEELYLRDFRPLPILDEIGLAGHDGPIVTLRPPPEGALYHRGHNQLFDALLDRLAALPETRTVVLPRHPGLAEPLARAVEGPTVKVLRTVVDGPSLIWASDAVVSGGGTMNREAVVLGTPVWTLFASQLGGVDRRLIAEGRLGTMRAPEDVAKFSPAKQARVGRQPADHQVLEQFVDAVRRTASVGTAGRRRESRASGR